MKRLLCICSFIIYTNLLFPQSGSKTWIETSVQEFSDNELNNTIINNNSEGEVSLTYPLRNTLADTIDDSPVIFTAKDSSGNIITTWTESGKVYFRKYSSDSKAITDAIQVNKTDPDITNHSYSKSALFNDGTFAIIWIANDKKVPGTSPSLYCQLFKNDSIRVGSNTVLREHARYTQILANEKDGKFWFAYNDDNISVYGIFLQKLDKTGTISGEPFKLNPDLHVYQYEPSILYHNNEITAVWIAYQNNINRLYYRKYSPEGSPKSLVIQVNELNTLAQFADLCYDDDDNLLIVWEDGRDADILCVYGQLFNSAGIKDRGNFPLQTSRKSGAELDVQFINGEFKISRVVWSIVDYKFHTVINRWKLEAQKSGEMISSSYFAGNEGAKFNKIYWDAIEFPQTDLKFQIRSARTPDELKTTQWYGPTGTEDFYQNSTGENINHVHSGDMLIQYQAFFSSQNLASPVLKSVIIDYNSVDSIPPSAPGDFTALSDHSKLVLSWTPCPEKDISHYVVHRGTKSMQYDPGWKLIVPKNVTTIQDTSAQVSIQYYYVITAVDSSLNESKYSKEATGKAYGNNIYVSAAANTGGNGSITNPFRTIQEGINTSINGDTIRVLPGVYNDSFNMKNGVSIIGSGADDCCINTEIVAADNCVIKGFTITRTIRCISVSPFITGNRIRGISEPYSLAVQVSDSASPVITRNFITEWDNGIQVINESNPLIMNNIIITGAVGIQASLGYPDLINNTIITKTASVLLSADLDTLTIRNNILVTSDAYFRDYIATKADHHIVTHNNFWNVRNPGTSVRWKNQFFDPGFVNISLQDYHLMPESPCINAGNPYPAYNDADGSRNDIGAYGGPDPFNEVLASQLTRSISASSISGYPGDTVSVFINMDNTEGLSKASFKVEYDNSVLKYLNSETTEVTKAFHISANVLSNNEISFSLTSENTSHGGDENILLIRFIVNSSSKTNDSSPFILKNIVLQDPNLKEMNLRSVTNGIFVVNFTGESERYFYVDALNKGYEDGSRTHPFNRITEAVNKATEGDTVFVAAGDYHETVTMKNKVSVIGSGASVTKVTATDDNAAFHFSNIQSAEISGFTAAGDDKQHFKPLIYCEASSPLINKMKIDCNSGANEAIGLIHNSSAVVENCYISRKTIWIAESNPVIKNCVIEGSSMPAIMVMNNSEPEIYNNIIKPGSGSISIDVIGSKAVIKNNLIKSSDAAFGIAVTSSAGTKIYNNIFKAQTNKSSGISILNSSGTEITNNSIITTQKGIEELNSQSTILNNIIINNAEFGLSMMNSSKYNYNDLWNNIINYKDSYQGQEDISADPLFIDTSKNDYRLLPGSLCINAGNPDAKYNDIDGSRNDIGAYGGAAGDSKWLVERNGSLEIDSVSASLSDTVEVNISGSNLSGSAEFDLTLSFDENLLKMINASTGSITKNFSLGKTYLKPGVVNLKLRSNKGITGSDGEILRLILAINSSQPFNTDLVFNNALIRDETSYLKNVSALKNGKVNFKLSGVNDNELKINSFALSQNYPNPFNPATKINYELPGETNVQLKVYDILGKEVTTLVNDNQKAGKYEVEWNASDFSSGIYFCMLKTEEKVLTKKMLLLK